MTHVRVVEERHVVSVPRRHLRFAAAVGGLLMLMSAPARATTMVRMSDEALTLGLTRS
jgi:hypothetical protein